MYVIRTAGSVVRNPTDVNMVEYLLVTFKEVDSFRSSVCTVRTWQIRTSTYELISAFLGLISLGVVFSFIRFH